MSNRLHNIFSSVRQVVFFSPMKMQNIKCWIMHVPLWWLLHTGTSGSYFTAQLIQWFLKYCIYVYFTLTTNFVNVLYSNCKMTHPPLFIRLLVTLQLYMTLNNAILAPTFYSDFFKFKQSRWKMNWTTSQQHPPTVDNSWWGGQKN